MTASLGDRRREKIDALAARAGQVPADGGGVSLTRSAIRRLRRDPVAILGAVIIVVFLVVAALAPWLAPRDPLEQALLSEVRQGSIPGSREGFPLGVDQLGRDVLSRLIYGSRQSLLIGVVSTVLGAVVGMALGVLAGAFGGRVDTLVMRFVDILLSIPGLLMAISISVLLGQNQYALMIAIAVTQVPVFARLLRGSMLAQRDSDYVEDRAGPRAAELTLPGDRAGHAVAGDGDHRGGGAELPRARRPGHQPTGMGGDALQRAVGAVVPAAAGHLPGAVHHRGGPGLHPAR
jgi:peptide/nickel transport system permease protein